MNDDDLGEHPRGRIPEPGPGYWEQIDTRLEAAASDGLSAIVAPLDSPPPKASRNRLLLAAAALMIVVGVGVGLAVANDSDTTVAESGDATTSDVTTTTVATARQTASSRLLALEAMAIEVRCFADGDLGEDTAAIMKISDDRSTETIVRFDGGQNPDFSLAAGVLEADGALGVRNVPFADRVDGIVVSVVPV